MTRALRGGAWAGLALALLFTALPASARAPDYPALTGRVVDQAQILSEPAERRIDGWLESFEHDTRRQAVVVTVKSLEGTAIEDYGVGLGRKWGIGEKDTNTGAILLVAPNDRQVRIEVGYGLEGELTDALSRAIIEQKIIPAFKRGDYETGITDGTAAMLDALGWTHAPPGAQPVMSPLPFGVDWVPFVILGLIMVFWVFRALFGLGRRNRPGIWGARSRGWADGGWSSGGWTIGGGSDDDWGGSGGFSGDGGSFGGGGATGRW
ncbi:MAG: YgcG family protein [Sphingomonadales bacterium]